MRKASLERKTKETEISIKINLDGSGKAEIDTGISFFDHMLTALTLYSGVDISIKAQGDLKVDDHHLVEDVGIALGKTFFQAMGDKTGITRFSSHLTPMDESLSRVALDISNRPFLDFNCQFYRDKIGGLSLENINEFLYAFAMEARVTLHIDIIKGNNDHHKAEAIFKGLGRALNDAISIQGNQLLSTKGTLS